MRQVYSELIAARGLPPAELGERILLAWSFAHGYATLVLEEQTHGLYGLAREARWRPARWAPSCCNC
ncbi:WHG domain-containing protein [Hylemonella gracilis]|uniref:WHG domain-containing protein n=1 Tax=Hylemonella gracilis TaxID=80880 RepID=A0A4P6UNR7_9BURK|nr:WHG domain-containing protein [Hylemonella gracilis]